MLAALRQRHRVVKALLNSGDRLATQPAPAAVALADLLQRHWSKDSSAFFECPAFLSRSPRDIRIGCSICSLPFLVGPFISCVVGSLPIPVCRPIRRQPVPIAVEPHCEGGRLALSVSRTPGRFVGREVSTVGFSVGSVLLAVSRVVDRVVDGVACRESISVRLAPCGVVSGLAGLTVRMKTVARLGLPIERDGRLSYAASRATLGIISEQLGPQLRGVAGRDVSSIAALSFYQFREKATGRHYLWDGQKSMRVA